MHWPVDSYKYISLLCISSTNVNSQFVQFCTLSMTLCNVLLRFFESSLFLNGLVTDEMCALSFYSSEHMISVFKNFGNFTIVG